MVRLLVPIRRSVSGDGDPDTQVQPRDDVSTLTGFLYESRHFHFWCLFR